jgi:DNA-binding transcriptional LysR family regulator
MTRYDPRDMLVFAKVAELNSISAAARALSTSKATVSRSVTRLESALNARLLER